MSGKWLRRKTGEEPPRFSRVQIDLGRRDLALRRPAPVRAAAGGAGAAFATLPAVAALGPDPLADGVDARTWPSGLQRSKKPIKPQLLDQRLVARRGEHPGQRGPVPRPHRPPPPRPLARPPPRWAGWPAASEASIAYTLKKLLADIGDRASQDVRYVEEPAGPNPFLVYDRAGEPCPRCRQGTITRLVQEARATFYCPHCQK